VPDDRPLLARRLRLGHLIAVDAVGAAVLLIAHTSFSQVDDSQPQFEGPFWFVVFIAAVISLPVAVRRLWPEAALAVSQTRRRSVAALMVCGAVVVISVGINAITTFQDYWTGRVGLLAFVAMMLVVAWTSGVAVRERREYAIRSAEQLARNAVGDERLRIARELHDVVAHSMSLIAVKAGIANHVADQRPQVARDALRVIEQTSRGTLNEMRRMLGVLRSETDEASLAPIPGLAGLPELAERARMAGVEVSMAVPDVNLPEGVELSVYRIVQEALTNVVKHAAPARCDVMVKADGHEVSIEVTDDGPGGTPGKGHGLVGMRERS
jgi:signal transduction histidine kinase